MRRIIMSKDDKFTHMNDKMLKKMDKMLQAIHNPNFEKNLKNAAEKLKTKKRVTEMDLVNEMNKTDNKKGV